MRKIKYFKTKNVLNLLNQHKQDIFVINHIHFCEVFEILKLKSICKVNNAVLVKIQSSLIKKLFKNSFFINTLCGPTDILFFKNFNGVLNFFMTSTVKKKILPLIVYWNKKFYDFNFFISYIQKLKEINIKIVQTALIHNLTINMIDIFNFFSKTLNLLLKNFSNFYKK